MLETSAARSLPLAPGKNGGAASSLPLIGVVHMIRSASLAEHFFDLAQGPVGVLVPFLNVAGISGRGDAADASSYAGEDHDHAENQTGIVDLAGKGLLHCAQRA
jgi:hypothetical protein